MYESPDPIAPTVVILAAGLGTRYGGNKPFAPAGPDGEPLLAYALHDAKKAGAGDAVLVVREADATRAEGLVETYLSHILPTRVAIQHIDDGITVPAADFAPIAAERRTPWGTGHAVLAAWQHLTRATVVLNGDDFYGADAIAAAVDFARALEGRRRGGKVVRPMAALIGYPVASTASSAGGVDHTVILQAPDGRVTSLEEITDIRDNGTGGFTGTQGDDTIALDDDAVVAMNCWALPYTGFDLLAEEFAAFARDGRSGEFQLSAAISGLITRNAMRVMMRRTSGPCFGLTHPDDLDAVQARLAALVDDKVYPAPLVA